MIVGTALFWSYTALFASVLVEQEILEVVAVERDLERTILRLEEKVRELKLLRDRNAS